MSTAPELEWDAGCLMTATLGYAILAVLARTPSTGYQLAARLTTPVSYFWTARHSQIHPQLQRLLADGLVAFQAAPGPGPKGKKVYTITPQGLATLRHWVAEPPAEQPVRDELVLKTYAAWVADRVQLLALFGRQLAAHQDRLARYEANLESLQARLGGTPPPSSREFGSYATLRCGISYERHRIGWCQWMIQQLQPPQ
jgi:DNA-binding PadR family transcriptional regulator